MADDLKDSAGFGEFKQSGGVPKLTNIFECSTEFLEQLALWLEMRGLRTPISQILGFQQFTANNATVLSAAGETTTSTTYTNLTTTGPEITGLSDGKYILLYGGYISNTGGSAVISVQTNSTAASDDDLAATVSTTLTSVMRATAKTLSNSGNNTVTLKYRVTAGTGTYTYRWLIALKYANA